MAAEHQISIPPAEEEADDQVEKLFSKLALLERFMDEAERRSLKETEAKEWMKELMDLCYAAHEWWDEFRIISTEHKNVVLNDWVDDDEADDDNDDEKAEQSMMKKMMTLIKFSSKKVRSFVPFLCFRLKNVLVKSDNDLKTKVLNDKLDKLLQDASQSKVFNLTSNVIGSSSSSSSDNVQCLPIIAATLRLDNSIKFHNEDQFRFLLRTVIRESEQSLSVTRVITIGGKPGLGKTTTVKLIYNDDKVKQCFQLRRWVSVTGNLKECLERIAKDIIGVSQEEGGGIQVSGLSWKSLFRIIEDFISKMKFLVVMVLMDDDVWDEEDFSLWEQLNEVLNHGAPGSIILVTSHNQKTLNRIGNVGCSMHPMPLEQSWQMLQEISLSRRPELRESVEVIGRDICKKCNCFPFAVKIIATHLRFKNTVEEWKEVLNHELWEQCHFEESAVRISYNDLPLPLQRCFLYLASFSREFVFDVDQLLRLWMAKGYLGPPSQDDKRKRKKGLEYFSQLMNRSFFHNFVKGSVHKNKIISFQMDARVHDFAAVILKSEPSTTPEVVDNGKMPSYLIVSHPNGPKELFRQFDQFRFIKVLDLSSCQLRHLPNVVERLILLEYLNLSNNQLKHLPEAVCNLYYLQFLDVHLCYVLSHLPHRIREFQQLKHLRMDHTTDELQQMPRGFEQLTSIQTLDVFRAGGKYNDIAVLKDFINLEEICIVIHGKVKLEDAALERKTKIESLELCFVGEGLDVAVVTSVRQMEPPPNLGMLKLEGYQGLELPKWIVAPPLLDKLTRLTVRSPLNLVSLPELWKLSSLTFLWLYDIPKLKHLDREFFGLPKPRKKEEWESEDDVEYFIPKRVVFPSLITLRIEYMENLATWEDLGKGEEKYYRKCTIMPNLEEFAINGCMKLDALPDHILGRMPTVNITRDGQTYSIPKEKKAGGLFHFKR
ncbi:OLC1v1036849C2 [Oldenlandia corymbosa var. corymbosa]|uniref:OLC1v1036849C2 n=1 Tax=Oldenlandia corymbosa var. corymbosa TaxID=529605 RepID=A0AAV1CXS2_OLDCO|nr:OLC1v1036849C2 [Oldenlandia corymbosa var. corymbosa]